MGIGSYLRGFSSAIKPVIAIDDTFLKGKYKENVFVALCMDSNNQIYSLAFGIGDSGNNTSWEWFLTKLRDSIGNVKDLVCISDHNGSIKKSVATMFVYIVSAKI